MPVVVATPINVGLVNQATRLDILVTDADGTPINASSVNLVVMRLDNTVIYSGAFGGGRITNPATGRYTFSIGDVVYTTPTNPETGIAGEVLLIWNISVDNVPISAQVQKIWLVSAYALSLASDLREVIDKAAMEVDTNPENPCFLGYTDAQLYTYLFNGLSIWNMYEPFPTFWGLDSFPQLYRYGLIEAALYVGLTSQELFAVATDIPNYSAQGTSFVIQHQPALNAIIGRISQRLDKLIPEAKKKLIVYGAAHVQMQANYRFQSLVVSAPSGALFRNTFQR